MPPNFSAEYFYFFSFFKNADYTNHQIADLSEKLEQAESQVRSQVQYFGSVCLFVCLFF